MFDVLPKTAATGCPPPGQAKLVCRRPGRAPVPDRTAPVGALRPRRPAARTRQQQRRERSPGGGCPGPCAPRMRVARGSRAGRAGSGFVLGDQAPRVPVPFAPRQLGYPSGLEAIGRAPWRRASSWVKRPGWTPQMLLRYSKHKQEIHEDAAAKSLDSTAQHKIHRLCFSGFRHTPGILFLWM